MFDVASGLFLLVCHGYLVSLMMMVLIGKICLDTGQIN